MNLKIPSVVNWVDSKFTLDELSKWKNNFGWALDPCDLVIDVDTKNGKTGYESLAKLRKDTGLPLFPSVITPSGGCHIYIKKDPLLKVNINYDKYPGIDFLSYGRQVVIPGSITDIGSYEWFDTISCEFIQLDCPESLTRALAVDLQIESEHDTTDLDSISNQTSIRLTVDELSEKLKHISNNSGYILYDDWFAIGLAVRYSDNTDEGFKLFDKWSKTNEKYDAKLTKAKWDSMDKKIRINGKKVTTATLYHYEKLSNKFLGKILIDDLLVRITNGNKDDLNEIMNKLPGQDVDDLDRDELAKKIQSRLFIITGVKASLTTIKKRIRKYREIKEVNANVPEWCNKYVYLLEDKKYINKESGIISDISAFNYENTKLILADSYGKRELAHNFVINDYLIESAHTMEYLPAENQGILDIGIYKIYNSYNLNTVPESKIISKKGFEIIEMIKTQIRILCTTDVQCEFFTNWLAYQVQHPGVKLKYSPCIQGIQGCGKSYFGNLLSLVLGSSNVGIIRSEDVANNFNSWAIGKCVNIIEELKFVGMSRDDVMEKTKSPITDDKISIEKKGKDIGSKTNITNYISFTNHRDALPLTDSDRRWWIIFCPIVDKQKEFLNITGMTYSDWFNKLFSMSKEYACEIRTWLLEHKIPSKFYNEKLAPMTQDKLSMIAEESSKVEGYEQLLELIETDNIFYNKYYVLLINLCEQLSSYPYNIKLSSHQIGKLRKRLNYTKYVQGLTIGGKRRNIYTQENLSRDKLEELIKQYEDREEL